MRYIRSEKRHLLRLAQAARSQPETEADTQQLQALNELLKSVNDGVRSLHYVAEATKDLNDELKALSHHHAGYNVSLDTGAIGIEQFLSQLDEQNPDLSEASGDYVEEVMRINPPVDPLFRVGEIGLGYDKDRDMVVLFAKELLTEEEDPESAATVRFWATRTQVRMLARWGVDVASRGRTICPQCGQPEEPGGHFCPKKNGRLH